MSWHEVIRLAGPLKGVKITADGGAPLSAAELDERLKESYQKGYEEAQAHLSQQVFEQRNDVNILGEQLFSRLDETLSTAVREVRDALPVLTMHAVRRVLAGISPDEKMVGAIVEEVLAECGADAEKVTVRLHPEDLKLLSELEPELTGRHPGLDFVVDDTLGRGDCQAVTRFGKLDARLSTKIEKLESSLRPQI